MFVILWYCMLTLYMTMHAFISELGRTSVKWWPDSERDYDDLTSREGHSSRGTRDMGKSVTYLWSQRFGTTCSFDEELVAFALSFALLFNFDCTIECEWCAYKLVITILLLNFTVNICKMYSHPFLVCFVGCVKQNWCTYTQQE